MESITSGNILPREFYSMREYTEERKWKAEKRYHIMDTAFRLFSERGIDPVTMPEIAEKCGLGRATVYRYFETKPELVMAIGTRKWEEYIDAHNHYLPAETLAAMTGSERLRFFMDSFIDLYRNHRDILRFNYFFNNYVVYGAGASADRQSFMNMLKGLAEIFYSICERGKEDGTLRDDISEENEFASLFHIMLAAVTRYASGLVYVPETEYDLEHELVMLEEMLLARFITAGTLPPANGVR